MREFRENMARDRCRRGFTLMEMLIVVAVIAVLLAIAIPTFADQLEKSRQNTDLANERSAYAVALSKWMTDGGEGVDAVYYFNGSDAVSDSTGIRGYGQSSHEASEFSTGLPDNVTVSGIPNENGKANFLSISVNPDGTMRMNWGAPLGTWSLLNSKTNESDKWYKRDTAEPAYNQMIAANDNATRVEADMSILRSIAAYFEGMSIADAQSILGSQYTRMRDQGNGARLFAYCVDGGYSIRLNPDGAINNLSFLSDLGYTPRIYATQVGNWSVVDDYIKGDNNYVDTFLFTSDEVIGTLGKEWGVWLSFDESSSGRLENVKVYINGLSGFSS